MPDSLDRMPAALADRYALERELGRGASATVYLARDLRHDRPVALKVLNSDLASAVGTERFLQEIRISARLTHPHILSLHDSGEADGFLYCVMPYVEGESLRDRLEKETQLPVDEALRITREVADALSYAHAEGVIHRDIKPENILLESGHAIVADFGIARAIDAAGGVRLTETGVAIGTPLYMSPEQATGTRELDARSDLYSLGCVLHEMLAGQPPFTGPTGPSVMRQHVVADPPDITGIRPEAPAYVAAALHRALSKTPADRFATVAEFATALSAEDGGAAVHRTSRRRRTAHHALAAAAAVALVAAGALVTQRVLNRGVDHLTPPPDRPYTLLATVDGSADDALRETVEFLLRSALDMAHAVQTVPGSEVSRSLGLMGRPSTAPLDAATARELAERLGVSSVVHARLDAVGSGLVLAVRVEAIPDGNLLAEASRRAADPDSVVGTVDAIALELRRELGETRATLANREPLPQVLTPSLDALRSFREGVALLQGFLPRQAISRYREALELDPEFAAAHMQLSAAYHNLGDLDAAHRELELALATPGRLGEGERRVAEGVRKYGFDFARWDGSMFRTGAGNADALLLADFQYFDSAWTVIRAQVRQVVRRHRRFDPDAPLVTDQDVPWRNFVRLGVAAGKSVQTEALRDSLRVDAAEYWALVRSLASSDWRKADSIRASAPDIWGSHVNKRIAINTLDAAHGRIRDSYKTWASLRSARVGSDRVRLLFEVVYGLPGTDTIGPPTSRRLLAVEPYVVHGVRAALLGDTVEAKRVAARLETARDSATSDLFERAFEPMFVLLDAGVAMRRNDLSEAVRLLTPVADRLDEVGYGFSTDRFLIPWILAEIHRETGQPDRSIAELEHLLDERSFEPLHVYMQAPAHFQLGRLLTQAGDTAKAVEHFNAFLDAFTDPDAECQWMVDEAQKTVTDLSQRP